MTSANVLSSTLKTTPSSRLVTVAAGCFWGVERVYKKMLLGKGLVDARVGYANGNASAGQIDYRKVCSGTTNFAEAIQISYEPAQISLGEVLEFFFRIHDPTTVNAQGPDVGTQYRSAIFTHSAEDVKVAEEAKAKMQKEFYPNHPIVTKIEPIQVWYEGEEYHQQYLEKNPAGYECPTHFYRTVPKK